MNNLIDTNLIYTGPTYLQIMLCVYFPGEFKFPKNTQEEEACKTWNVWDEADFMEKSNSISLFPAGIILTLMLLDQLLGKKKNPCRINNKYLKFMLVLQVVLWVYFLGEFKFQKKKKKSPGRGMRMRMRYLGWGSFSGKIQKKL